MNLFSKEENGNTGEVKKIITATESEQIFSKKNAEMNSTQHYLLGLSPHYWTYIPMLNQDIHNLKLINGVDCYVVSPHSQILNSKPIQSKLQPISPSPSTSKQRENKRKRKYSELGRNNNTETLSKQKNNIPKDATDDNFKSNNSFEKNYVNIGEPKIVPVTRCELVGIVVNITRRSNGATFYLLDDGTGLVDCLAWQDAHEDKDSPYYLPSISLPLPTHTNHIENETKSGWNDWIGRVKLGDLVRIRGKIRCIDQLHHNNDNGVLDDDGIIKYVREVHVKTIEKIWKRSDRDCEAVHWLQSIKFKKRVIYSKDDHHEGRCEMTQPHPFNEKKESKNQTVSTLYEVDWKDQEKPKEIYNGSDMLSLLGPKFETFIAESIKSNGSISSARMNKNFSSDCSCKLSYKDQLLYCHCVAIKEALDPKLHFRDAVLTYLLRKESDLHKKHKKMEIEMDESLYHHNNILNKRDLNHHDMEISDSLLSGERKMRPLYFQYKSLVENSELFQTAMETVSCVSSSNSDKDSHQAAQTETKNKNYNMSSLSNSHLSSKRRSLYMNTFRALRKDGILFLLDIEKDKYMLLSRYGVLEPFLEEIMVGRPNAFHGGIDYQYGRPKHIDNHESSTTTSSIMPHIMKQTNLMPDFLKHVPYAKIKFLKKEIKKRKV